MRRTLFTLFLLAVSGFSFGQGIQKPAAPLTKNEYLHKRFKQNTIAHIMLWGGTVAAFSGAVISVQQNYEAGLFGLIARNDNPYNNTGDIIGITGFASMLGSIPFFIAASKNRKAANRISLSVKRETRLLVQNRKINVSGFPCLSIKIGL